MIKHINRLIRILSFSVILYIIFTLLSYFWLLNFPALAAKNSVAMILLSVPLSLLWANLVIWFSIGILIGFLVYYFFFFFRTDFSLCISELLLFVGKIALSVCFVMTSFFALTPDQYYFITSLLAFSFLASVFYPFQKK